MFLNIYSEQTSGRGPHMHIHTPWGHTSHTSTYHGAMHPTHPHTMGPCIPHIHTPWGHASHTSTHHGAIHPTCRQSTCKLCSTLRRILYSIRAHRVLRCPTDHAACTPAVACGCAIGGGVTMTMQVLVVKSVMNLSPELKRLRSPPLQWRARPPLTHTFTSSDSSATYTLCTRPTTLLLSSPHT